MLVLTLINVAVNVKNARAPFDSKEFHLGFSGTEIECVMHVHASRTLHRCAAKSCGGELCASMCIDARFI